MKNRFFAAALFALICTSWASVNASAATLTFNSASYATATSGLSFSTEDFSGYNLTSQSNVDFGDFSATGPDFDVKSSSFCAAGACLTSIDNTITLTFDFAVNAVNFLIDSGNNENVKVDGSSVGNISIYSGFVGLYDFSGGFTSISLTGSGSFPQDLFDIDNLSYAVGTPGIPAPASFLLLALGLGMLTASRTSVR